MSGISRGWFPVVLKPQQQLKLVGIGLAPGDWADWPLASRSLDAIEHFVPPQVMAMFPDFASWLRSVRRDDFTENPVFAIERLNTLTRPLQDAHKDTLVGAVLTMSSSLHLALDMLLELLPQEKSRDRLGEVLCPTLGHLLSSLQNTLFALEPNTSHQTSTVSAPPSANGYNKQTPEPPRTPVPTVPGSKRQHQPPQSRHDIIPQKEPRVLTPLPSDSSPGSSLPDTEKFPPLQYDDNSTPRRQRVETQTVTRQQTVLVKALQTEMRVQAAIHVAVESLEFAEGQLKLVKEINGLHGGSFDIVQKQFYEGYNRLLFRALDLERRECRSLPDRSSPTLMSAPYAQHQQHTNDSRVCPSSLKRRQSVSFQHTLPVPPPAAPRPSTAHGPYPDRRPLSRRNTIQETRQENSIRQEPRPTLKRRLSLAEELAMVGEDSESGYQDETSEMATSGSEMSDTESCNDSHDIMAQGGEGYSLNGESAGERSTTDKEDNESDEGEDIRADKTLDASDVTSDYQSTIGTERPRSRLPRLKQA